MSCHPGGDWNPGGVDPIFLRCFLQKKIVAVTGTATATAVAALATNITTTIAATTATATTNSSSNDGDCHDHNQRPFFQDSKWQVDLTFMDKPMLEMNDLELLGDRHC